MPTCSCVSVLMKTERLQVLIETARRERLEQVAATRGVSVAALVRTAIDVMYPTARARRRRAGRAILDVEPIAVPGVAELREELDERRGRRG